MDPTLTSLLPTRVLTCAYDGTHRLAVEADLRSGQPSIVTNYTYDKADNRTQREIIGGPDAGVTTYVIGDGANGAGANQIKQLTRPDASVVGFGYDLTGARTSRSEDSRTDEYQYDVWDRLLDLDFQTPADPAKRGSYLYSYDARTRRVSREELGTPTISSFQGGLAVQEYAAAPGTAPGSLPNATVEYVRGPGMGGGVGGMYYSVRGGAASLSHSNVRGDVVAKVDEATSAITWEAQYEAFGKRPVESGTNPDRQRANTKEEDPTGLLNEGFRYRDLETGTFITRDPAGFVDGPNLYTYVRQNPWTKFDPEGLREEDPDGFKWSDRDHHVVPASVARDAKWDKKAKEVFDKAKIKTPNGHNYSAHSAYNAEVSAEMAEFLKEKGFPNLEGVSARRQEAMAKEFVERISNSENRFIRGFNSVVSNGPESVQRWFANEGKNIMLKATGKIARLGAGESKIITGIAKTVRVGNKLAKGVPVISGMIVFGAAIAEGKDAGDSGIDVVMSVTNADLAKWVLEQNGLVKTYQKIKEREDDEVMKELNKIDL